MNAGHGWWLNQVFVHLLSRTGKFRIIQQRQTISDLVQRETSNPCPSYLAARMNTLLQTLLEILKYTLPSAIVLGMTYLVVKQFLVSEMQRKQIALLHDSQNVTLPLRLQAYERLTLFTERIQTRQIMPRVYASGMTVADLRTALVLTINAEWEHNLTQQIYVSRQVWETVKHMKEQELALIHGLASQLAADAPGKELQVRLADYLGEADGDSPGQIALAVIAEEAKRVLSFGASQ